MLAYVFWHRPADGADPAAYEADLRAFHAVLAADPPPGFRGSVAFGRAPLEWFDGYEDWYLVDDWTALGALNAGAVAARRLAPHDRVAGQAADGTGAVYLHTGGTTELTAMRSATWSPDPVAGDGEWRRQMTLGPAPQYCALQRDAGGAIARAAI